LPDDLRAAAVTPPAEADARFDAVSMLLHWATALLVVAQFATAWAIDWVDPGMIPAVLATHRSSGLLLWSLVAGRLVWRALGMRKPPLPPAMTRLHRLAVTLSEAGLYGLLLVQPLTGLADSVLRGRAFPLFGLTLPALVHRDRALASLAHTAHAFGGYALAILVGLHALAALVHHFILKDGVLASMLPFRCADKPKTGVQPATSTPR
jgi:superoxide oxidase